MKVRVRVAPSPTGSPHVGTAFMALFNYVLAKKHGGDFIVRIEDTDRKRSTLKSEEEILKYLKWLGLDWSEGPDIGGDYAPYRQSERDYKTYADLLLKRGDAYRCFCSSERLTELREKQRVNGEPTGYDGFCRSLSENVVEGYLNEGKGFTIRLKVPSSGLVHMRDLLRGEITFDSCKLDDPILLKSDGMPTYHLANVVDDHNMKITHVIRAEEWIPSTPKHTLLYKAFGWEEPLWVHMPILRNSDKSKISKRENATSLSHYYEEGYLKEALLNFLALLGWHSKRGEIFSIEDMIDDFNLEDIHIGGPVFDRDRLNWMNSEYIKKYEIDDLMSELSRFVDLGEKLPVAIKIVVEIRKSVVTVKELANRLLEYLDEPKNNYDRLKDSRAETIVNDKSNILILNKFISCLRSKEIESVEDAKLFLKEFSEEVEISRKHLLPLIRLSTIGMLQGLEVTKILTIFSKEEIERRVSWILTDA